jgi:ribosomal protein S18 acetylase RimI-like enzyme
MSDLHVRAVALERTRELRQAVLRPHETVEAMAYGESSEAFAVGAFLGEELVSVGLIAPDGEPGGWRIRGMATAPGARGAGAGSGVLEALVHHAQAAGAQRIWCNARTPARRFYERAGFRVTSKEFELPMIGPHLVMELRPADAA